MSFVPSALCGFPVVIWGRTGLSISPSMKWSSFFHVGLTSAKRLQFRIDWLTYQARYVRGEITRRTMHASGKFTMSSLSQALLLEYLPFSHSAFQDHAAHIVEWSTMLRPNGSWGTCIPQGMLHSFLALHGAPCDFPIPQGFMGPCILQSSLTSITWSHYSSYTLSSRVVVCQTPCSARRELCYIAMPGCHSALPLRSHNASTEEGRALEHATHA